MFSDNVITAPGFNRQTILLVDDNEDDVLIMCNSFTQAAISNPLQTLPNGEEAIAYIKGGNQYADRKRYPFPIVVFLDLSMPKKNGLEVLEWIRSQPILNALAVHILTASNRSMDVERAFELGANSYIIKPSRVQALVELLKAWHTLALNSAFPRVRMEVTAGAAASADICTDSRAPSRLSPGGNLGL